MSSAARQNVICIFIVECQQGGRTYSNGETWKSDSCTECECSSGRVECRSVSCPATLCNHPAKVISSVKFCVKLKFLKLQINFLKLIYLTIENLKTENWILKKNLIPTFPGSRCLLSKMCELSVRRPCIRQSQRIRQLVRSLFSLYLHGMCDRSGIVSKYSTKFLYSGWNRYMRPTKVSRDGLHQSAVCPRAMLSHLSDRLRPSGTCDSRWQHDSSSDGRMQRVQLLR